MLSLFCDRMFELKCLLPFDNRLKVRIKDHDLITHDELIGETIVDLESRFLSKHRATCGLPQDYILFVLHDFLIWIPVFRFSFSFTCKLESNF